MNLTFFYNFVRNPRYVGSLIPSFHYLGDTMRDMIDEIAPGPLSVAVLGVGTAAVARSFVDHDVYGYDLNQRFLSIAKRNLPTAKLSCADVCALEFSLVELEKSRPIAIVSCIPVLNLSPELKAVFQAKVTELLEDPRVVCFVQYTYGPRKPLELPCAPSRQRWVLRNLPPAGIYLWRRSDMQLGQLGA